MKLGAITAHILETPGHTLGHIVYHLPDSTSPSSATRSSRSAAAASSKARPARCGTACGKLRALPDDTTVYCAHEYTASNAAFALSVDAENRDLVAYADEVKAKRANGIATVPTTIGREKAANPFLRADDPKLQAFVGHPGDEVATFAEVRERKNKF